MPDMKSKMLHRLFNAATKDLFFSRSGAVWTDDPGSRVVQLRNSIVELVEGRVNVVSGTTALGEHYLLAKGDQRYVLVRVLEQRIVEGTYFDRDWSSNYELLSKSFPPTLHPLEIKGTPYNILKEETGKASQIVLTVEPSKPNAQE